MPWFRHKTSFLDFYEKTTWRTNFFSSIFTILIKNWNFEIGLKRPWLFFPKKFCPTWGDWWLWANWARSEQSCAFENLRPSNQVLVLPFLTTFHIRWRNKWYIIWKPVYDSIKIRNKNGKSLIHSVSKLVRMKKYHF